MDLVKARRIAWSFLLLAVVTGIFLGACTTADESVEYLSYAESLRGTNDLAHASLEVPALADLRSYASVSMAQRYVGQAPDEIALDDLKVVASRFAATETERLALVCDAVANNTETVREVVADADSISYIIDEPVAAESLEAIAAAARAAKCLGKTFTLSSDQVAQVSLLAAEHPDFAVSLVAAGVVDSPAIVDHDEFAATVAALESGLQADGCDEDSQAQVAAAMALGATVSSVAQACAEADSTSFSAPFALRTLVDAGVSSELITRLLAANEYVVKTWTATTATAASDWGVPVGLGTLSSTRDLVELLELEGIPLPAWISSGTQGALDALEAGVLDATEMQDGDLLFLCRAAELKCPESVGEAVSEQLAGLPVSHAGFTFEQDNAGARLMFSAIGASIPLGIQCSSDLVSEWYANSPAMLWALTAEDPDCLDYLAVTNAELEKRILEVLGQGDAQQAIAYARIRDYIESEPPEDEASFQAEVQRVFQGITDSLDAQLGTGYIQKYRPLDVELLRESLFDAVGVGQ
jgi:hypothetical protein